MEDKLAQALDECLELLREGVALEECLSRYPEYAREFEPLLQSAQAARPRLTFDFPAKVRQRIRNRVMAEWDQEHAPKQRPWHLPALLPRWAAVVVSVLVVVLLGGATTANAARDAVPGEVLYPVKIAVEEARLAFTFSKVSKAELHIDLAERRVGEIRSLVEKGQTERIAGPVARLAVHLEVAKQLGAADGTKVVELRAYLENSATVQLSILEQILAAASEETKSMVEAALVTSADKYGTAIEVLAVSAPPSPLLAKAGTVEIFVTDPPPPDVDHVWVEVDNIEVHRTAGPDSKWITIVDEPVRFDLVAIVGVQEFIGSKEIEAGFYTQLRMNVTQATVVVGEEEHDAFVPNGRLEFVRPFQVKDGEIAGLLLDFDGDRSINVTGAGQYILKLVVMLLVPEKIVPPEGKGRPEKLGSPEEEGVLEGPGTPEEPGGPPEEEGVLEGPGAPEEPGGPPEEEGVLEGSGALEEPGGPPEEAGSPQGVDPPSMPCMPWEGEPEE